MIDEYLLFWDCDEFLCYMMLIYNSFLCGGLKLDPISYLSTVEDETEKMDFFC